MTDERECEFCNGTGHYVSADETKECEACNGKGILQIRPMTTKERWDTVHGRKKES